MNNQQSLYDREKYTKFLPSYLFLSDETDATVKAAIHLSNKEIDLLFRIRNHATLDYFFSGKLLRVWKDDSAKINHFEILNRLSEMGLILVFPEFRFKTETKELLVYLNLLSGKEFNLNGANHLKEIFLNSLSRSSFSIQNYILSCEPYHVAELIPILEFLLSGTSRSYLRDSFDCKKWIVSFCYEGITKEEVISDCIDIILKTIQDNGFIAVTKTAGLFHIEDELANDTFKIVKKYYLEQFIPKIILEYPKVWNQLLEFRKNLEIEANFEGSLQELEEILLSQELNEVCLHLEGLPEKITDFITLCVYIGQKNDQERYLNISTQELRSIKLLKTMMSLKNESLSKFVMINLEEDREFSFRVIENIRNDRDYITGEWFEKGKKFHCLFNKNSENVISLMDLMIHKFAYKKELLRSFLYVLHINRKTFPSLFSNIDFQKSFFKLKFLCFENQASWFDKILFLVHAYGWLETSLDRQISKIQFEQMSKGMEYVDKRRKDLEKIKKSWIENEIRVTEIQSKTTEESADEIVGRHS
ncbi:exonuclease [Leptospira sp. 201903070]|uniref:Exonuclease n=1 Tax=Leptospira ainlahdjerensis TaxID=2810033 RepID=A0ABS2UCL5_9LEPT|nr:exonuclease [Leptospira ainlahdjerensis]MBM9578115.1 exonuclease [Leptospira ainlahdjerensis]